MNPRTRALTRRTFSALQFRNYRLYFTGQIISFSGTWMQSIALAWLVLQLTGSGTALGTVMASQFLPTLLLAPIGGMVADRADKRRLIPLTQSLAGALALTLGVVTVTGVVRLWMVYVLAAGFGAVTAVDNPSRQIFVMEMVGPEHLGNAVTLNAVVVNAARVIGPAVGGLLIATLGVGECFIANALSYGAVVIAMFLIRRDELHPSSRARRAPGQLREGFRHAWNTPTVRTTLVMLVLVGTFTFEFQTTLPLLSEFTFHAGAGGLAAMTSLMGAGAAVGGLVVAGGATPTPQRLVVAAAAYGISVTAVSAMPSLASVLVLMPLVGAAGVATISMSNAVLQLNSDPRLRGRIMAMFSMSVVGSTPIGGPLVGAIGEHVGPRVALLVGGFGAAAAAAYGHRSFKRHATGDVAHAPALSTP